MAVSQAFIFHFKCYSIWHFAVFQLLCLAFLFISSATGSTNFCHALPRVVVWFEEYGFLNYILVELGSKQCQQLRRAVIIFSKGAYTLSSVCRSKATQEPNDTARAACRQSSRPKYIYPLLWKSQLRERSQRSVRSKPFPLST